MSLHRPVINQVQKELVYYLRLGSDKPQSHVNVFLVFEREARLKTREENHRVGI